MPRTGLAPDYAALLVLTQQVSQTLEALGDALYVAPVIETGDYHSSLNARSWLYVFEYQTKNSFYKQVRLLLVF